MVNVVKLKIKDLIVVVNVVVVNLVNMTGLVVVDNVVKMTGLGAVVNVVNNGFGGFGQFGVIDGIFWLLSEWEK